MIEGEKMHIESLPDYKDVESAAERIKNFAHVTPVLTSQTLNLATGAECFIKCENFQRMGAFKFRGAMNALSRLSEEQKRAGVLTFSSGNHAQAVALSASLLNISATIVMPFDAPEAKLKATQGYGGKIIQYDRYKEDREEICRKLVESEGMTFIHPYDHPDIIAGQGTAVRELIQESGQLDALFVCLGGGGLLSGSALAARTLSPECKIYGVEPEAGNDGQKSFRTGKIVHIDTPVTLADGAQTQHLGENTFKLICQNVDDILTVTDDQLIDAMRFFAERMKIVVEPTGCLAFAAAKAADIRGLRVGIIISGGNVDLLRYSNLLAKRV